MNRFLKEKMLKKFLNIGILLIFYIVLPSIVMETENSKLIEGINLEKINVVSKKQSSIVKTSIYKEKNTVKETDIYTKKHNELLKKEKELKKNNLSNKEWFIAYKKLINEYSKWCNSPKTIYNSYTKDEINLMQRCIETEAYQADFDSKCNVASVILNRLKDKSFPDVVGDIIVHGQFAFGRKEITKDTILAIEYVFMIEDTTDGALYFHSNSKTAKFNKANYIFTDKVGHHFYK